MESGKTIQYIYVWDLPSGTLQPRLQQTRLRHSIVIDRPVSPLHTSGWESPVLEQTFQEEVLEHPGDRFQRPNHLYCNRNKLKIRLNGREGPLFSALPSHLGIMDISLLGDGACILSEDVRFLLLDTSGLEAYMDICNLQFQPFEVSRIKVCWFLSSK